MVLNVLSTTITTALDLGSVASGGEVQVTGLTVTITPKMTSSKMLLLFSTTSQVNGSRGRYTIHYSGTNSTLDGDQAALTAFEGSNINHVVAFQYLHLQYLYFLSV